jgi:hypothetical protein
MVPDARCCYLHFRRWRCRGCKCAQPFGRKTEQPSYASVKLYSQTAHILRFCQFVANMLPGLILSISAPYWFHLVSYKARILMVSVAMGFACIFVGCGGLFRDEMTHNEDGGGQILGLLLQLFGVSLMSLASCLGEVREFRHNCLLGCLSVVSQQIN